MIHTLRMIALGAAAVAAGAGLAGCGGSGNGTGGGAQALPACLKPGQPLALAIGARSNSPTPSLSTDLKTVMNSAVSAHQKISIVRLDGNPRVVFSEAFSSQGANSQTAKVDLNAYVESVNQILVGTGQPATDIRAQTPQADVLAALTEAASEVPPGGDVIVMDSGLQTTAPLNFSTGLLNDDPQTVVDFLKGADELPDLADRNVYFSGLGWTASPQPALDVRNQVKVVQIWEKIATAAGASCVSVDPTPETQDAVSNRPPVAIVTPPSPPAPPVACSVIDLGDANNVGFDFDSTTFRNPSGAHATLQKLANVMLRTGESVTLTGATSSEGNDQYNLKLSLERAEAVKAALVHMSVPTSRITTYGDGSHLPGRLNDRGPNGQRLIGPAIQNRKVVAKLAGAGCPAA